MGENSNSRTINSLKNIIASFGGKMISMLFSFLCRMVFVRYLSSEYLGVNGMFTSILSVLSLAELGIGSAIIFELYRVIADNNEEEAAAYMHFYSVAYKTIGIIVAVIGIMLIPFLQYFIGTAHIDLHKLTFYYCMYIFNTSSSYFFSYKSTILIADQKNYIVTLVNNCFIIIQNLLQILSLVLLGDFTIYLIIQIICTLINNFSISKIAEFRYPCIKKKVAYKLSKEKKDRLIVNIKSLMITKISGTLINSTDNLIIGAFINIVSVGVTSNFSLLISSLNSVITPIFDGLTASVGNYNVSSENNSRIKLFYTINLLNYWLYGWAAVSFAILGNDLVQVLFGSDYLMETKIVIVMAINFYMVGMSEAVWLFKKTLGLFKYGRWMNIFTGIINIVCSIILGKLFGIFGVLVATAIARGLTNFWYDPYAVCKHGLNIPPLKYALRYIKMTSILIITYIVILILGNSLNIGIYFSIAWKLLLCICIPNVSIFLCYRNSEEFNILTKKVKKLAKSINEKSRKNANRACEKKYINTDSL